MNQRRRRPDPTADSLAAMSPASIDGVLADLGTTTAEVIATAQAAAEHAEELRAAYETLMEQRIAAGRRKCEPDPQRAIAWWRYNQATKTADDCRTAAREFAAWWADLATVAMVTQLLDRSLHPARAAAADPAQSFRPEDLEHLPQISDHARGLADLSLSLASPPPSPGEPYVDFDQQTMNYLATVGMRVAHTEDGERIAEEDGGVEGRRCRLWGRDWIDDEVPTLPTTTELAELLAGRGLPEASVTAVCDAAAAVESAIAAQRRARELDAHEPEDAEQAAAQLCEGDVLLDEADQLTDLLAAYARTSPTPRER